MAQLAPNPPTERISQLLPTVKCSSCAQPVPLDQLGNHVCPPASLPLNIASNTKPVLPPLKAPTPQPSLNASIRRSPMDMFFPRRRPSAPQDITVQDHARLRGSPSPGPSLLSRSAPSRAPSRNGVRSPAPSLNSTTTAVPLRPPSRTQTQRPELAPNVVIPSIRRRDGSINTRSPIPAPSPLDSRSPVLRRPSNPQSPPDASSSILRRPSNPQSSLDARSPIQRRPSIPQPPLATRSPIQRRPSGPQSPPGTPSPILRPSIPQSSLDTRSPIQRRPSAPQPPPDAPSPILRRPSDPRSQVAQASNNGTSGDPRSVPMPQPNHHPVRASPSPAPSSYSGNSFVSPEVDTKSGGAAGMAGVGRRGFEAAARAAMFASSPTSRMQRPTADMPAPWVPSSSPRSMDDYRINTLPLALLDPPAGMSSLVHLHILHVRRCYRRCP